MWIPAFAILIISGVIVYFLWEFFKRAKRHLKLTKRKNWQLKQIFFWLIIAHIPISFASVIIILVCIIQAC